MKISQNFLLEKSRHEKYEQRINQLLTNESLD